MPQYEPKNGISLPSNPQRLVGLGYVGLPIAVAFGKHQRAIGFDINKAKIAELQKGIDRTGEVSSAELKAAQVTYTSEPSDLKAANFIIVAVPTPISDSPCKTKLPTIESKS